MTIGLLALQGGYALHEEKFKILQVDTRRVVTTKDLRRLSGLVIPGGESTVMLKNGTDELWKEIVSFSKSKPIWGICAGTVMVSKNVKNPIQKSLGIMDLTVMRNAYGSQNDSFIGSVEFDFVNAITEECLFIRAPKIVSYGSAVTVLATFRSDPIMVEQERHLATTFHPELGDSLYFHQYFLEKILA